MSASPAISVVMPVRHATRTISASLDSLLPQCGPADAEIVAAVCEEDPTAQVLSQYRDSRLRVLVLPGPRGIPQLRRDALLEAKAPWVAITEDHCAFSPGWLRALAPAPGAPPRQVRGGPVANGCRSLAGWALYFSRYTAFMPPVTEGLVPALPGNSACYPRQALLERAQLWKDGFWETEVNAALRRDRFTLWMSPALEVRQHQSRRCGEYIGLRYRHGRLYAARQPLSASGRLLTALRTPLVPFVMYARAATSVLASRTHGAQFLAATPLLLLYYASWAAGEAAGYFLGVPQGPLETD